VRAGRSDSEAQPEVGHWALPSPAVSIGWKADGLAAERLVGRDHGDSLPANPLVTH
jgi:hypothetical protein